MTLDNQKLKHPRTCYGCKATDIDKSVYECFLHYSVDIKDGFPLEPCPKPITNKQFVTCKRKGCIT